MVEVFQICLMVLEPGMPCTSRPASNNHRLNWIGGRAVDHGKDWACWGTGAYFSGRKVSGAEWEAWASCWLFSSCYRDRGSVQGAYVASRAGACSTVPGLAQYSKGGCKPSCGTREARWWSCKSTSAWAGQPPLWHEPVVTPANSRLARNCSGPWRQWEYEIVIARFWHTLRFHIRCHWKSGGLSDSVWADLLWQWNSQVPKLSWIWLLFSKTEWGLARILQRLSARERGS